MALSQVSGHQKINRLPLPPLYLNAKFTPKFSTRFCIRCCLACPLKANSSKLGCQQQTMSTLPGTWVRGRMDPSIRGSENAGDEEGEIFMRKFVNFFLGPGGKHTKGLSRTIWGHLSLSLPTPFLFMSTQK